MAASSSPKAYRYLRPEELHQLRDAYAKNASLRSFSRVPAFLNECFGQQLTELELLGVLDDYGYTPQQAMGVDELLSVVDHMKERRAEGVRMYRYLRLREVEELKAAYDTSGGLQSFHRIRQFLQERFGQLLTDEELYSILSECGYEVGHCMSLGEFLRVMDVMKRRYVEEMSQSTAREAFGALADTSDDGELEVSMDYLRNMMNELGLSLATLEEADEDGSGFINFDEFDHLFDHDSSESESLASSDEETFVQWQGRCIPIRHQKPRTSRRHRRSNRQRASNAADADRNSSLSGRMNVILLKDELKRQSGENAAGNATTVRRMLSKAAPEVSATNSLVAGRVPRHSPASFVRPTGHGTTAGSISISHPTTPGATHTGKSVDNLEIDFDAVDSCGGSDASQDDARRERDMPRPRRHSTPRRSRSKKSSVSSQRDSKGHSSRGWVTPPHASEDDAPPAGSGDTLGEEVGGRRESCPNAAGENRLQEVEHAPPFQGWDTTGGRWRGENRPASRRERQVSRADFLDRVERSVFTRKKFDRLHQDQAVRQDKGRTWNPSVLVPTITPKQDREAFFASCEKRPQSCPPSRTLPGFQLPALRMARRPMTGPPVKRPQYVPAAAKQETHARWLQGCAFRGERSSKLRERFPTRSKLLPGDWTQ
eukprot:TRINITY_DN25661_c0_g1_i1.p1 TRINITY_DN25661_c0_g1~~TRINITY_DN25661_c0_g1_i1.p1  ORF type:complete len:677 (+),score=148.18 TRINITY_DN25661_c0_g1_i1:66-2033(+)